MASLAERLNEVAEQLTKIETEWSFQGVSDSAIGKVSAWRDTVLEAVYALNTGRHSIAINPAEPRVLGVRAMEQKLRDLRWELTPREYQEYVANGALYSSIMESVIDALLDGGYEIVKRG